MLGFELFDEELFGFGDLGGDGVHGVAYFVEDLFFEGEDVVVEGGDVDLCVEVVDGEVLGVVGVGGEESVVDGGGEFFELVGAVVEFDGALGAHDAVGAVAGDAEPGEGLVGVVGAVNHGNKIR